MGWSREVPSKDGVYWIAFEDADFVFNRDIAKRVNGVWHTMEVAEPHKMPPDGSAIWFLGPIDYPPGPGGPR